MKKKIVPPDFLIILLLLLFLVMRAFFITPSFSDETIYINMAEALKEGLVPYKDFFYAHPPIQLLLLFPAVLTNSFLIVKIYISLIGVSCIFLTYLIAKELFNERAALVSSLAFLIFPGFLIFGNLAMGTFEALLFFLMSFYFFIRKRIFVPSLFLLLSILTRYLALLLSPFLMLYIFLFHKKQFPKFLFFFMLVSLCSFAIIYLLFGYNFIKDTVIYHLTRNIKFEAGLANWIWQYISFGFFTTFISLICISIGYFKKDLKLILFSSYPLIYDITILLIFKQVIYHYFAFALPLLFVSFGRGFVSISFKEVKFFLAFILLLSVFGNWKSLYYYFDKNKNLVFDELVNYTLGSTHKDDLIFGEPRSINYISFVTDRKIALNYFDSDLKHLSFEGLEKIVEEVKKAKPKIIVADANYYGIFYKYFEDEYEKVKEWNVPEYYHIILMKRQQ
jgi:hypothetical protein